MFSVTKKEDRELLLEISKMISALVKVNTTPALDLAEKFGGHYVTLSEKIKHHSYTQADIIRNQADARIK